MPVIVGQAGDIVDLDSVKTALKTGTGTPDTQLWPFIDAASQMIVNRIGPVVGAISVEEWHDGGANQVWLRQPGPIASVTAVTESFGSVVYTLTEVDLDDGPTGPFTYTVDLARAVLVRRAAGVAVNFAAGVQNIHVTYVSGYTEAPADIKQATLLLIQHMWDTQRGSSGRPNQGSASDYNPGTGFAFPHRVLEILAPYMTPGVA